MIRYTPFSQEKLDRVMQWLGRSELLDLKTGAENAAREVSEKIYIAEAEDAINVLQNPDYVAKVNRSDRVFVAKIHIFLQVLSDITSRELTLKNENHG